MGDCIRQRKIFDLGRNQTHVLWFGLSVALPTELRGQMGAGCDFVYVYADRCWSVWPLLQHNKVCWHSSLYHMLLCQDIWLLAGPVWICGLPNICLQWWCRDVSWWNFTCTTKASSFIFPWYTGWDLGTSPSGCSWAPCLQPWCTMTHPDPEGDLPVTLMPLPHLEDLHVRDTSDMCDSIRSFTPIWVSCSLAPCYLLWRNKIKESSHASAGQWYLELRACSVGLSCWPFPHVGLCLPIVALQFVSSFTEPLCKYNIQYFFTLICIKWIEVFICVMFLSYILKYKEIPDHHPLSLQNNFLQPGY